MQRRIYVLIAITIILIAAIVWKIGLNKNENQNNVLVGEKNSNKGLNGAGLNANSPGGMAGAPLSENITQLFDEWFSAVNKNDSMNAQAIGQKISQLLMSNYKGNEAVYQRMAQILNDPSVSREVKLNLINMLVRVATPSVVQLFLDSLKQKLPPDIRQPIITSISQTGDYFWDKQFFPETTSMLLNAWSQTQDPEVLRVLASAITRVGDINSINQLLAVIPPNVMSAADIQAGQNPKTIAALNALNSITRINPEIIPDIARSLNNGKTSAIGIAVYTKMLGSAQTVEASRCLIEFAQNANERSAAPIQEAVARIYYVDSQNYIATAMQTAQFRSNAVRSAILSVIKKS
jgi:hypothetical protein